MVPQSNKQPDESLKITTKPPYGGRCKGGDMLDVDIIDKMVDMFDRFSCQYRKFQYWYVIRELNQYREHCYRSILWLQNHTEIPFNDRINKIRSMLSKCDTIQTDITSIYFNGE